LTRWQLSHSIGYIFQLHFAAKFARMYFNWNWTGGDGH
jgi:hypothetical protein